MSSIIGLFQLLVVCGTALLLTMLVLASLPSSRFRDVAKQVVNWLVAVFAGLYVVSPIDLVPEAFFGPIGGIDDLLALVMCIVSARSAWAAGRTRSAVYDPGTKSTHRNVIDVTAKEVLRGR